MRKQFTSWWDSLNSNAKSAVISVGAFLVASALLYLARFLFPNTSFNQAETVLATAFSGFLVHFVKEWIRQ